MFDNLYDATDNKHTAYNLAIHGGLHFSDIRGTNCGCGGNYYVYMWKHLDGTPFYIGSGKGNRWLAHGLKARTSDFLEHLNRKDAIVDIVSCGLTEEKAREAEFCCVHSLTAMGFNLAQTVWNCHKINGDAIQKQADRYDYLMTYPHCRDTVEAVETLLNAKEDKYDLAAIHEIYENEYKYYESEFAV